MKPAALTVASALVAMARTASAAPPVVIVRHEPTGAIVADALRRVGAELAVRTFPVATAAATDASTCTSLRAATASANAVGGIAVSEFADREVVVLTVDRHAGTCVEQVMPLLDGPDAAADLALRSFEALRAHFLERELRAHSAAPSASPVIVAAAPISARDEQHWVVRVGAVGRLPQPVDDVAWARSLTLLRVLRGWRIGVAIAPASSAWRVEGAGDTAVARARSAFAGVERRFGTDRARAFITAAVGVVAVTAAGAATAPARALERTLVTPAAQASVGAELSITRDVALVATAGVELWRSTPVVQLRDVDHRTLANPILVTSLALAASFGGP